MNFDQLQPTRGSLDPAAIAYEAGRRSVKRWPWQACSGVLAAAVVTLLLFPRIESPPTPQLVQGPTPSMSPAPLAPTSLLALRHATELRDSTASSGNRPSRPLRVGDRSL
ncbi:MAG: hypothetical protein AAGD32_15435 [Planctomycetota bacterium]